MANRNITLNRQNLTIVPYHGSLAGLAPFFQNNLLTFRIQVVDPSGDPFSPWDVVDYAGASGLTFTISSRATGTVADSDEFVLAEALEADWTWDAVNKWWTGSVNINTPAVAAWLGILDKRNALLEIQVITGNDPITIFFHEILIRSSASAGSLSAAGGQVVQLPLVDGANGVTIVANKVTVTGLTWLQAPRAVRVTVTPPNETESGFFCWTPADGLAATGFYFLMSGLPDSEDYLFEYEAIF